MIDPASIVMGLSSFSICSTECMDLPMPPCMHIIFFSISAASGRKLKSWLNRVQAHIPSFSPYKYICYQYYQLSGFNSERHAYLLIPFSQCIRDGNQRVHLCQQLHGFHGSNEHSQDTQSAQLKQRANVINKRYDMSKVNILSWFTWSRNMP